MAHVTRARTSGARLDEAGTSGGAARSAADGGAAHDRRAHGGRADGGRSVGALVKQGTEQLSELMRQELRLAQAELTRKGKQAGFGGGLFGGAGLMAFFGLACLITAAIAGIAGPLTVWAAALIVAGGLMLLAAILALAGRREMKRAVPPVPGEAVDSVRTDLETMKERATKHDSR
ncbi:phage holin family protein [Streptomyces sp. HPF1205]|uniref:phage holin family protein n=1 Tax=Streptomyces sp. HPF1205 TaxID=2873262 RepID=UPI0027E0AD5E|nr:phage holin family protein [Streptomyces sp. HPF1205]